MLPQKKSRRLPHPFHIKRNPVIIHIPARKDVRNLSRMNPVAVGFAHCLIAAVKPLVHLCQAAYGNILRKVTVQSIQQLPRIARLLKMKIGNLPDGMYSRIGSPGTYDIHLLSRHPCQNSLKLALDRRVRRMLALPSAVARAVILYCHPVIRHKILQKSPQFVTYSITNRGKNQPLNQLRNARNRDINLGNTVPGSKVDHSRDRKSEDTLETLHRLPGCRPVDSVRRNRRNGRVGTRDARQLFLNLPDLFSRRSDRQIDSRPGRRDARDLLRRVDKHVIAVIVAQNLNRLIILIAEILAAPLAQPVAAGHALPVAILR